MPRLANVVFSGFPQVNVLMGVVWILLGRCLIAQPTAGWDDGLTGISGRQDKDFQLENFLVQLWGCLWDTVWSLALDRP